MPVIRIATRKSPLALAQSRIVEQLLAKSHANFTYEIVVMLTSGDKFISDTLSDIGGKGLFTKELDEALLNGSADIAVHSMKDVPTILPEGLMLGAVLEREDARDVLISPSAKTIAELPQNARFGTASLRRAAQVLMVRPDVRIVTLRGNVQTRLDKIARGEADATMLAKAGLNRLGLTDIGYPMAISEQIPAIAQGAVGVICRANDTKMLEMLQAIHHAPTGIAIACERAFLRVLDGSCRTPIAGYAEVKNNQIQFKGLLATPDGKQCYHAETRGNASDAEALGQEAGEKIKHQLA